VSWSEPPRSCYVWAYRAEQSTPDLIATGRLLNDAKVEAIRHARGNPDQEVVLLEPQWTLNQLEWQFIVVQGEDGGTQGEDGGTYYDVVSH
jgi:hypothetical protein